MRRTRGMALLVLVGLAETATADPRTDAEQLFRDGQTLVKAGRIAEACLAFEGSQRIDPSTATLMNLADCREREGRLTTAWGLFLEVVREVRADPALAALGEAARKRAGALEPRLSHLTISVAEDGRAPGLVVVRDEVVVDPSTWNRAIPVDGGRYVVEARAPGHQPWSGSVDIGPERHEQRLEVPRLVAAEMPPPPPPAIAVNRGGGLTGKRTIALVVGAGALAIGGAAIGFELSGRSTLDEYERTPAGPTRDDLYARANRKHHVAQGLAVAGAACAGGAIYLWLTGGRDEREPGVALLPALAPGATGLAVTGAF